MIKTAKEESWKQLCAEIEENIWRDGYKIATHKYGKRRLTSLTIEAQQSIARELFVEHDKCVWKTAKLILIDNPTTNRTERQYRPLCLINSIAKLLEHVILKRLMTELEEGGDLSQ